MSENHELLLKIRDDIKSLKHTNEKIKKDIEEIKDILMHDNMKLQELQEKLKNLGNRFENWDRMVRMYNLMLFRVPDYNESKIELFEIVMDIINKVKVNIKEYAIISIYRVGKYNRFINRPIIIKLISPRWKQVFFEKLKEFAKLDLAIANDLSLEEREEKRDLLRARYLLRNQGEEVTLRKMNLYRKQRVISTEEINSILQNE